MTIRQQGGVFGRNPTFNDLQVDGNATFDGSTLVVDGVNNRVGINSPSPRDTLEFKGLARLYDYSGQDVYTRVFTDPSGKLYLEADKGNTKASSGIVFTIDNAEAARFNSSGNLAFVDGKGIDFSATSGTGTSELFDDYEEGTWTPVDASGAGLSFTTSNTHYTKIGNMVMVTGVVTYPATADASAAAIGGLPYAAKAASTGFFPAVNNASLNIVGNVSAGSATFYLAQPETTNNRTNANMSGKLIAFSGTYLTS